MQIIFNYFISFNSPFPWFSFIIFSFTTTKFQYWRKYSYGRQDAAAFFANIMTANRVFDTTVWGTLAADIIYDTIRMNTLAADGVPVSTEVIL